MKRLNIFVDETGGFGFGEGTSRLYGISFVFHEQDNDISKEINVLNSRLDKIGYYNMIHTAALIINKGEYKSIDAITRKEIFKNLFNFSRRIEAKYHTIIIDKKYINNNKSLKKNITLEINKMINNNLNYFKKFDKIVIYYDNGQIPLGKIIDSEFSIFNTKHITEFDHTKKRLFQIADMLTFIDKIAYKTKHKLPITNAEKYFFEETEMRKIIKRIETKRL